MKKLLVPLILLMLVATSGNAKAGLIDFKSDVIAEFELTLYPVFTGAPDPITAPGLAKGIMRFVFDFDPTLATLDFVSVTGEFDGTLQGVTDFNLRATGLDSGTATNVVVLGDELVSADLLFSLFFEMRGTSPGFDNVLLTPNSSLEFGGPIAGLPFPNQTLFSGPIDTPEFGRAFVDTPDGVMVIEDAVSVQNRTLTTVPEPTSFAIFGFALVGTTVCRRRRKRSDRD